MPKLDAKFEKVIVRLFEGDRDRLAELYPTVGYNVVIRTLVRKHLRRLEEAAMRKLSNDGPTPSPDLDGIADKLTLGELAGEPALSDEPAVAE